jgi:hypothetical protein
MEVSVKHHATAALPRGKYPATHRVGGWVGPRDDLEAPTGLLPPAEK